MLTRGRYQPDRVKKEPGSIFLGRFFIEAGYWYFHPMERLMLRFGITPNQLTAASLACSIGGAIAFAAGRPALGGWLVIACAVLDALDGMVARSRGTASDAGELVDAAVDRYAEIATFAGIAAYYRNYPFGFWLAITSMGGALLVSYARAKGEISGIDARMGSMNRGERAVYIGVSGIFAPYVAQWMEPSAAQPVFHLLLATLAVVAVMANVTALRRFAFIHRELRSREPAQIQPEGDHELKGWFQRAWIASAIATVVDYGTFTLLLEIVGVYVGTSRAIGALLGAITNFALNKVYTFRTRGSLWVEGSRYAAISLTSLLLNTVGVMLLTEGLRWNAEAAAIVVGISVSLCWNLPLHRVFVFREQTGLKPHVGLSMLGAMASGLGAVAVLIVSYGNPFAEEQVHGFSTSLPDAAQLTPATFLPKLRTDAFYSESYNFQLAGEDGSFARVQFLVSNAGLEGHGKAAVRAVVVTPDGKTVEDGEAFDSDRWRVRQDGSIEMGASALTLGRDASQHVHFAGPRLVIDATLQPQTPPVRPGGGKLVFDSAGHAVVDETVLALRSRFEATLWTPALGSRSLHGFSYADTSWSTVPEYKTASLWYRMQGWDPTGATAMAVLFPPEGSRLPAQGWLYTSRGGSVEVRSTDVRVAFADPKHEAGGTFEYEVPQRVTVMARGSAGEQLTLQIDAKRLLYREDVVSEMSPLSRLLVRTVAAPMGYSYENRYALRLERPNEAAEERKGTALSEFAYSNKPAVPAF